MYTLQLFPSVPDWLPGWLGKAYATLYSSHQSRTFSFSECRCLLDRDAQQTRLILSRLHRYRAVVTFERSRPRVYRLLDPENLVSAVSGQMMGLEKIPQERYIHLVALICRRIMRQHPEASLCLYGSLARGDATRLSDVDLLLVSEKLMGSLGSRAVELSALGQKVGDEIDFLRGEGIHTGPSFCALRPDELSLEPLILLDITENGILLRDPSGVLGLALDRLKARLADRGARRVHLPDGSWYWDLAPGYKYGEELIV